MTTHTADVQLKISHKVILPDMVKTDLLAGNPVNVSLRGAYQDGEIKCKGGTYMLESTTRYYPTGKTKWVDSGEHSLMIEQQELVQLEEFAGAVDNSLVLTVGCLRLTENKKNPEFPSLIDLIVSMSPVNYDLSDLLS